MTSTADGGRAAAMPPAYRVPGVYHALAAAFVAWCVWMATQRPELYAAAMQEDRIVEWMSVFIFAAGGVAAFAGAIRGRRVFDALVGLFLLFAAAEEASWGQRLLGITAPPLFLEHNVQQELNVHNFANPIGGPKWLFVIVLVGYAVLLPLVAAFPRGKNLLTRIGATPPPRAAIPWFVGALVLLVWYPFRFTGEWTELLAGSAFLVSMGLRGRTLAILAPLTPLFAVVMAQYSSRGDRDPNRVACANAEVRAMARALGGERRIGADDLHKRAWTLSEEGRIDVHTLRSALASAPCAGGDADTRRRFAVDPWGTAYWIRVIADETAAQLTVYSFGPNRRRDMDASATRTGDDVFTKVSLSSR